MVRSRVWKIPVVIVLIIVSTVCLFVNADEVRVNWLVESNPGFLFDVAFSTCENGLYIYVAGFDSSTENGVLRPRVEKRLKSDGSLVKNWTFMSSEYGGLIYDCVISGDRIYAAGSAYSANESTWIVLVLDTDLNLLSFVNLTSIRGAAISSFCDQAFLYVAGVNVNGSSAGTRVIKMRLSDLSLVDEYVSNLSDVNYAYDISVNPLSSQIWVVGNVNSEKWRVEILDMDLNPVEGFETSIGASATSIGFDDEGYSYVAGDGAVIKLNKNREEVKRYVEPVLFSKTLWLNNRLYVAGGESMGGNSMQVLYVFDRELNLLNKTVISMSMGTDAMFLMGKMASDGENIYVAGFAYLGYYDYEWVVYSIKVDSSQAQWYVKHWHMMISAVLVSVSALLLLLMRRKRKLQRASPEERSSKTDGQRVL
jgi:hypothetical protein